MSRNAFLHFATQYCRYVCRISAVMKSEYCMVLITDCEVWMRRQSETDIVTSACFLFCSFYLTVN